MVKKTGRIIAAGLVLALFVCLTTGCAKNTAGSTPDKPQISGDDAVTDTYKSDGEFSLNCLKSGTFNPFTAENTANLICTQLMYDTLFELDNSFTPTPRLITDYKTSDGKCWYFYVDTTVPFWDGSTLTAQDAAYSIQRAMRSQNYSSRLSCVVGASAMDKSLFIVNLYYADMQFPALLNIPVIKYGSGNDKAPTGTGPYMPDGEFTKLTAFSGYKNAASLPVDTVYLKEYTQADEIITAFENSDIDLVTNDPTGPFSLGFGSANETRNFPTTNMHYLGFNMKKAFFSSAACRRAMTYVVDRDYIVTNVMGGTAAAAALPLNPTSPLYNSAYSNIVSYSVQKGQQAFDEANVRDYDKDGHREIMVTGVPIEIGLNFIVCSDSTEKVAAARSIADNLMALGITVDLRELSWSEYTAALKNGDFDLYYAETMMTPDFSLRDLLYSGGSLNYGDYKDSVFEQYMDDFMSSGDADRQKNADLLFKYITDNAPIVPIMFEKQQVITHRGMISGMDPTKYNIFHGIEKWKITLS